MSKLPCAALLFLLSLPLFAAQRITAVTSSGDSGAGTLRAALEDLNANCAGGDECRIDFHLPPGTVIEPLTPLPVITSCGAIHINGGRVQSDGSLPLELSGARLAGGAGSGIEVRAQCAIVHPSLRVSGMAINRFPWNGVVIAGGVDAPLWSYTARVDSCFIGTDPTGRIARPNVRGIVVDGDATLAVYDSIVSGNLRSGVFLWQTEGALLGGNRIGVDAAGLPMGNGASGVFLRRGSMDLGMNVIAHNRDFGVALSPGTTFRTTASIHSNAAGGIDWNLDGPTRAGRESQNLPNAPVIASATYDASTNRTIVTGTLRIDRPLGQLYQLLVYSNANTAQGERIEYPYIAVPATTGTHEWTATLQGDLRGRILTAVTNVAAFAESGFIYTSEFSEGVTAR